MEIFCEVVFEIVGEFYIELMMLIVPDKIITPKTKKVTMLIVTIFSIILFVALICGIAFWVQNENPSLNKVGKYMTLISAGIILIQITSGMIFKIVQNFRRKL